MSKPMIIYQVDAFTTEPFKGNPAGVCLLDKEMPDFWMQNVAAEMNLSETSFVITGGPEFPIRYFTPEAEIPLCGHATLSSAHILYETGLVSRESKIIFLSKAGSLAIRASGSWIAMNFPAYGVERIEIPIDVHKYIGVRPEELYRTGHGWLLALLGSEEEVRNMKPDFGLMKGTDYGDLIVTAPSERKEFDFCVRCFAPSLGINEDPVTGSAHCSLAPFWYKRTGKTSFTSHQVSKRGGILKVEFLNDRVEISGQAITILKGEITI